MLMRVSEHQIPLSIGLRNLDKLKISSVSNNVKESVSFPTASNTLLQAYYLKSQSKISFRGEPWKINLSYLGVPASGEITADEAIRVFEAFKLGNYLDIGDDEKYYYYHNIIRKQNLEFLNRVTSTNEKRKFVDYYKGLTGFPDLETVSGKIQSEFTKAVSKASNELNRQNYTNRYDVVQAGYDGVCSVGKNKALPGSDIDKAYVIIKGSGNKYQDIEDVNRFKGKLWENTDQRILSYNHDAAAFPQVYSLSQLEKLLSSADEKIKTNPKYDKYLALRDNYHNDYVEANPFYVNLCAKFPNGTSCRLDVDYPTKENIKNIGFIIEALREGKYYGEFGKLDYVKLNKSDTYHLTNLSQLKALKKRGDVKPKRLARESLEHDFINWSIDKQFRFIKTLIEASCANNTNFTDEFPQYFSKSGNDPFEPLINALMKPNDKRSK